MKYLFFSDLHGSNRYGEILLNIIDRENPDLIVDLGDNYYHGPRNPLPLDYAPLKVAEKLNSIANKTIFVKGNCDSDVDNLISSFVSVPCAMVCIGKRKVFCTHGDNYNSGNIPPQLAEGDILIYGHFHTGYIKNINNIICVNPGSLSLPKNDTLNSYAVIDETGIYLKDLKSDIISKYLFDMEEK